MIFFREFQKLPSATRIIRVMQLPAGAILSEFRAAIMSNDEEIFGGKLLEIDAGHRPYHGEVQDAIAVFKVQLAQETANAYANPLKTITVRRSAYRLVSSQECSGCHSRDHEIAMCPWPKLYEGMVVAGAMPRLNDAFGIYRQA